MLITSSSNVEMNVKPEGIARVEVDEAYNKMGAHAAIGLKAGGGFYVTKSEYDRVNAENNNILGSKSARR